MPPPQQRNNHQRNQPSTAGANSSGSNGAGQPAFRSDPQQQMHRQPSSLTQASANSNPTSGAPANACTTNVSASGALKIKVFFEDDLIAIRVPADIAFEQLKDKLRERLKVRDEIVIQYKDEPTNGYVELLSDRDLDVALQRNAKLTLYVGYA